MIPNKVIIRPAILSRNSFVNDSILFNSIFCKKRNNILNMQAISIKQPWASLIAHGIKDIENRTWKCPQKYIGQRVLIHAASSKPEFRYSFLQYDIIRRKSQSLIFNCTYDGFPKGAIIGSVVITDCVQNHPSVWAEKGCWNWVLKDAVLFDKPVLNVKGKLSFWEFSCL
jgi:hypothetical protein